MNNQDVRVIKTNNLIRTAFLALLAEKGFHDMAVQDILARLIVLLFISIFPTKMKWRKSW